MAQLNNKGFTLIETLMAASILILVSIALANVFGASLRRLNAGSSSLASSNSADLTFARIEKDLRSMIAFSPFPFTGSCESMTFPALTQVKGLDGAVMVRPTLVTYNYMKSDQGLLVRKACPFGVPDNDSAVVSHALDSVVFGYGSVNPDGALGWSDSWIGEDSSAVPYAIRIRMVHLSESTNHADSGVMEREIVLRLETGGRVEN